jgi:hypothetical protein
LILRKLINNKNIKEKTIIGNKYKNNQELILSKSIEGSMKRIGLHIKAKTTDVITVFRNLNDRSNVVAKSPKFKTKPYISPITIAHQIGLC